MAYYLVYLSTARHLMSDAELRSILATAREHNRSLDVTGALLYRDGTFMQVLEGDRPTVRALYTDIGRDPRHHEVDLLADGDEPDRQFEDWSMAFRDLTGSADELGAGFSRFLSDRTDTSYDGAGVARRLLRSFRRTMRATA